jgi:5'(3')-deoxyribonucleotidase
MQSELLLQLSVVRGVQLPRTELTSKIDAYVKVKAGSFTGKTKTKVPSLTIACPLLLLSQVDSVFCRTMHIVQKDNICCGVFICPCGPRAESSITFRLSSTSYCCTP